MFSSTGYEAYYTYLGAVMQSTMLDFITNQKALKGLLVFLFASMLLLAIINFFKNYLPSGFSTGGFNGGTALIGIVKVICAFMFVSGLLSFRVNPVIKNYDRQSWMDSRYFENKKIVGDIKVSGVYFFITNTLEEVGRAIGLVIDNTLKTRGTEGNLKTPDFFYKAMMYAGSSTIESESLRNNLDIFTNECLPIVLSLPEYQDAGGISKIFRGESLARSHLRGRRVEFLNLNCEELRGLVNHELLEEAKQLGLPEYTGIGMSFQKNIQTVAASKKILNHWINSQEDAVGTSRAAKFSSGGVYNGVNILQFIEKAQTTEGMMNMLTRLFTGSGTSFQNINNATKASMKFSEMTKRAPHLLGLLKMLLSTVFPFLVFVIVLGKWKPLVWWSALYFSLCLWSPLWSMFYHIMTNMMISSSEFQRFSGDSLNGGVFLYASSVLQNKSYYFYEIYSWIQLMTGPGFTGMFAMGLKGALSNGAQESTLNTVGAVSQPTAGLAKQATGHAVGGVAGKAATVVTGNPAVGAVVSGGVKGVVKR